MGIKNENEFAWNEMKEIYDDFTRKSLGYWFLHNSEMKRFTRIRLGLSIPVIILTSASGVTVLSTDNHDYNLLIGLLDFLLAIISAILVYLNLGERICDHKKTAVQFHRICEDIESMYKLPINKRTNAFEFYDQTKEKFDELCELNHLITSFSQQTLKRYITKNKILSTNFFKFKIPIP